MITDQHYGTTRWYNEKGELHRDDDLPAFIGCNGTKKWYKNNKLHRLKGPAVIWSDGTKGWFIEGKEYTEEEFNKVIKRRKELARWVYQRWYSDFMRNPNTERGQRYISKDYDRMMKELKN